MSTAFTSVTPTRIVGFGASSMQGVGDTAGGFFSRLQSHPALKPSVYTWANHGIGGNTLRDMLERAPRVVELKPYDLILLLGCNDLPRKNDSQSGKRSSIEDYTARLQTLMPLVQGRRSLFVTSFGVAWEKTGISPELFDQYMTVARSTALSLGYDLWDLYEETKEKTAPLLADDGVHFNAAGHSFIADKVAAWLSK